MILGGTLTVGVNYLQDYHSNALMMHSGIGNLVIALFFCYFDPDSQFFHNTSNMNGTIFGEIICLVTFSLSAMTMAIVSYQLLPPPIVAVLRSQEVVFAYIIETVAMKRTPTFLTILGAVFVFTAAILLPLENYFLNRLPNSVRRYF